MNETIYNLETAADYLGVTRDTIRSWIEERGLRALPLGAATRYKPRDYLIRAAWLLDWIEANSRINSAAPAEAVRPERSRRKRATGSGDSLGPCPV